MQSIIIPIDFTERSRRSLDFIARLYQSADVRFILLHAYTTLKPSELLISLDDIIEKDIARKLEIEGNYLKDRCNSNPIEIIYLCERNNIISAVHNTAKKYAAEIVVIGSDGENSWSDISLKEEGRTSNFVRELPYPILIVPQSYSDQDPHNFLFATMIDGINATKEIEPLVNLAGNCNAHIDILNVGSEKASSSNLNKGLIKTVNGYFNDIDFDLHTVLESDVYMAINEFSSEHRNELICIMYRKHSVIEQFLNPGVTKKMLAHLERPILVLKHEK